MMNILLHVDDVAVQVVILAVLDAKLVLVLDVFTLLADLQFLRRNRQLAYGSEINCTPDNRPGDLPG
eukprot:2251169-Rhodomonas_salina.1